MKVEIGDKNYYFTPSGDDAGLLTTLAGTSAGMLKESSDGLFELDGKKYGFDVASIPDSAFSYSEGSEDDYNFTMSEADADGSLTAKYYKTDLETGGFCDFPKHQLDRGWRRSKGCRRRGCGSTAE